MNKIDYDKEAEVMSVIVADKKVLILIFGVMLLLIMITRGDKVNFYNFVLICLRNTKPA